MKQLQSSSQVSSTPVVSREINSCEEQLPIQKSPTTREQRELARQRRVFLNQLIDIQRKQRQQRK